MPDLADLPDLATARQVADYLGTTEGVLAADRYLRRGIPYVRVGRRIRYRRSDIEQYLTDNTVRADD